MSRTRGDDYVDLALLTDGLRAEREQGITIDVAYRYFSTDRRKFILADCPGHTQYTRNVVTGTSLADVALLVVDARRGMTLQTRRHAFIASLMRVPHIVLCINKMDLVGFSEVTYQRIVDEFNDFAARLSSVDVSAIPISALHGDNIVERSSRMPWYEGVTVSYQLDHVYIAADRDLVNVRFPVQTVIRPRSVEYPDYRAYAGQVVGGVMKPGDEVIVLPSGVRSTVVAVEDFDGSIAEAFAPMCVSVRLFPDVDVSRGDMIARPHNQPRAARDIEAMVCVVADADISAGRRYELQHTTRSVRATVGDVRYRVDVETLHRAMDARALQLNDIGRIQVQLAEPIFVDPYERNRTTGSFVLVDLNDRRTVAAGVIVDTR